MVDPADLLRWGLWRRLATASRDIRRFERDHLDYIGQTGTGTMTLRQRLGRLRGEEMVPGWQTHLEHRAQLLKASS
jgi:hypothetical protein